MKDRRRTFSWKKGNSGKSFVCAKKSKIPQKKIENENLVKLRFQKMHNQTISDKTFTESQVGELNFNYVFPKAIFVYTASQHEKE